MIDLYLEWCGSCICMEPNYRTLYFGFEEAEKRIAFYRANETVIPEHIAAGLQHGPLTCKPRFLFYLVSPSLCSQLAGGREEGRGY